MTMGYTAQDIEEMKNGISDAWRKERNHEAVEVLRRAYDLLDGLLVEGRI